MFQCVNSFTFLITLSRKKAFYKAKGRCSFNTVRSLYIQFCTSLGSAEGLRCFGRKETCVGKSFGLSCRTEVQGLTLMREAKEFLRAETRRNNKFTRINTIARDFSVVTGQSLGDKSLGLNGLLARITRGYLWPYHGDRLD